MNFTAIEVFDSSLGSEDSANGVGSSASGLRDPAAFVRYFAGLQPRAPGDAPTRNRVNFFEGIEAHELGHTLQSM
jgi:hypothetical protein